MQNSLSLPVKIIYRLLAVALLTLGISFCLQLQTASPSYANACIGDSRLACLSTSVDLAVQNASASGGAFTRPRPGSTAAPAPIPETCSVVRTTLGAPGVRHCGPAYAVSSKFTPFASRGSYLSPFWCEPKTINGYVVNPAGVYEVTVRNRVSFTLAGTALYDKGRTITTCLYPPSPVQQETNIRCIVGYTAYFDRNANSYLGYGARLKTVNASISSAGAILANPASCRRSVSASMDYTPPTSREGWGQYTASSTIRAVTCSFASTTFEGASTPLAKCGGEYSVPGRNSALTIWCNGFAPMHLNKNWNADDCYGTGRYSCSVPTPATYNGRLGLVQGIRDGNNSVLQWGAPTPTGGVRGITNWESKATVNPGSTPFDTTKGVNDRSLQLFYSDNVEFEKWQDGTRLAQNIAFYQAGNSGAPFSMTRMYRYDAEFLTSSARIGSYDIVTGAITTSPIAVWVADTNVLCGPQVSPNIEVIRAIGDAVR